MALGRKDCDKAHAHKTHCQGKPGLLVMHHVPFATIFYHLSNFGSVTAFPAGLPSSGFLIGCDLSTHLHLSKKLGMDLHVEKWPTVHPVRQRSFAAFSRLLCQCLSWTDITDTGGTGFPVHPSAVGCSSLRFLHVGRPSTCWPTCLISDHHTARLLAAFSPLHLPPCCEGPEPNRIVGSSLHSGS